MSILKRLFRLTSNSSKQGAPNIKSEIDIISTGWDKYAANWNDQKFDLLPDTQAVYLGDEWTLEDVSANGSTTYGLPLDEVKNFDKFLMEKLLQPYLGSKQKAGLEIGPGGGRLTNLLLNFTEELHAVDASENMLKHLKQRFNQQPNLRTYLSDGYNLPDLPRIDYVISFDVFVHFEPRLIFWYLQQMKQILTSGGTGIIHYSNMTTDIGWKQFLYDVKPNLHYRSYFASFGVMCPAIMEKFLSALDLEIISSDLKILPRDAVAVFRKK